MAERPRRAVLALLLALPAAFGLGLAATGAAHLVDGRIVSGALLMAVGAVLVAGAFRWLRSINSRV